MRWCWAKCSNPDQRRAHANARQAGGRHERFNTVEVRARRSLSIQDAWADYESGHRQTIGLLAEVPVVLRRRNGALPWYGMEYDLEDYIGYSFYGHKREHTAQIAFYRDLLRSPALSAALHTAYA